jgi:hypothetical protein
LASKISCEFSKKGAPMKRTIGRRERILTTEELKGALGGTDNPPHPSSDSGSGQQTDARAVIIETGYS